MEIQSSDNRFETRMKGILSPSVIMEHDEMATAHRLHIEKVLSDQILTAPLDFLRKWDLDKKRITFTKDHTEEKKFNELVGINLNALDQVDLSTHFLFRFLSSEKITALVREALYWDLSADNSYVDLDAEAADTIFKTYDKLLDLPREAHQIISPLDPENKKAVSPLYIQGYSLGHSTRTAIYTAMLTKALNSAEKEQIISIKTATTAGFLHDIGKIQGRIYELAKLGRKLTNEEYEFIKMHPPVGGVIWNELNDKDYIREYRGFEGDSVIHDVILSGILFHHFRPDGNGYPKNQGVNPEKIPTIAKILAIADSFDAMTSHRRYSRNIPDPIIYAGEELKRCSDLNYEKNVTMRENREGELFDPGPELQFDPELVKLFLKLKLKPVFYHHTQQESRS